MLSNLKHDAYNSIMGLYCRLNVRVAKCIYNTSYGKAVIILSYDSITKIFDFLFSFHNSTHGSKLENIFHFPLKCGGGWNPFKKGANRLSLLTYFTFKRNPLKFSNWDFLEVKAKKTNFPIKLNASTVDFNKKREGHLRNKLFF